VTGETGEDDGPDSAFNATLDLDVYAPREVFVRGQGVDAEFGGNAKLSGSIDDPAVRGRLDLRRGSMTLLSQRITISRGTLQFLGDVEPLLDIAGGITKNGVTATVSVKGKASDPQIALSSVPKLPQDEILSRLLFSKQTTQLSPFEAAQLAETVGKWSGLTSGPAILDRLRTALGIDALSATTDESGATAVNAGRYVGRGVFVGVSQASGGSATVDVDITDEIKLRGEAGATGTKIGVAAEWEY
jgi:translocation and assembly module TamB